MKKSFLFLAVCAAALTACTSEEVIEEGVQSNAIGFQQVVGKESRALTNSNLNNFYVYGYYTKNGFEANPVNVFDGENVKLVDGAWVYDVTRYWVPETKYYFYAYSCENRAVSAPNGSAAINLEGDDVKERALNIDGYIANNGHQHDLIFATNDTGIPGKEKDNAKVPFTFNHILTRVNVVFSSEFAPGYDIIVSDVKMENIYDKANYDPYAENVWNTPERTTTAPFINLTVPETANVASAAEGENAEKKVTTGNGFVIPVHYTVSSVRLVFDIEVKSGETSVLSRTLTGTWQPNWVAGTAYTYNVKIAGTNAALEPIVFETSENMNLDGWDSGTTTQVNFTFSAN